jgi:hypothetical protein
VADVDALPPSITGTDERAAEVAELSSLQPATSVEEVAPTKSQPLVIPQECDAPEGVARATSPEIQETGEGSGAAQPQDAEDGDARILDLTHVPWSASFEAGDDGEGDEVSAACNTLEHGLTWARRAFDELMLFSMSVSSLGAAAHLRFLLFFWCA